jgi:hypothetical protein
MTKTRKNRRHLKRSVTRGWKKNKPGYHQRTLMLKHCGRKCFLGPNKSYPICKKRTCKIDTRGVYSAYIRARQFHRRNISKKAKNILILLGAKR